MDLGDSEDTIALRVPDHELAREILRRTGPMAVSSANRSGQPAALTCDEAIDQLGERSRSTWTAASWPASGGPPSTIVDFTQSDDGEVLRVGALSVEVLRETLPDVDDLTAEADEERPDPADSWTRAHATLPGSGRRAIARTAECASTSWCWSSRSR